MVARSELAVEGTTGCVEGGAVDVYDDKWQEPPNRIERDCGRGLRCTLTLKYSAAVLNSLQHNDETGNITCELQIYITHTPPWVGDIH